MGNKIKIKNLVKDRRVIDSKVYHDSLLLLRIYSDVSWNNISEYTSVVRETCETFEIDDYRNLEIMADFGEEHKAVQLKERLLNVAENKIILDTIDKTFNHVKLYPYDGELYYDILELNFFDVYKHKETDILEKLSISRSKYYRKRKEAIHLFGVSLWGFVIPSIIH